MRVASKVGTFLPNFGTLGLYVLKLFAMYATDGQKQRLLPPPYGRGHNNKYSCGYDDEILDKRHK